MLENRLEYLYRQNALLRYSTLCCPPETNTNQTQLQPECYTSYHANNPANPTATASTTAAALLLATAAAEAFGPQHLRLYCTPFARAATSKTEPCDGRP